MPEKKIGEMIVVPTSREKTSHFGDDSIGNGLFRSCGGAMAEELVEASGKLKVMRKLFRSDVNFCESQK